MALNLLQKNKERQFTRILIGSARTGVKGLQAPIKSIAIDEGDPLIVYKEILSYITKPKKKEEIK